MDAPTKRLWIRRLNAEHKEICLLYGVQLVPPLIDISSTHNVWGDWNPALRSIRLSEKLLQERPWWFVVGILKHEMAHQCSHEIFRKDDAHGTYFQMSCDLLGVPAAFRRSACEDLSFCYDPREPGSKDSEEERDLSRRAQRLLALADSHNEHESLLAMQKLREMYLKYNKKTVEKWSLGQADYVTLVVPLRCKRVGIVAKSVASILVAHFFVEIVMGSEFCIAAQEDLRTIEILGTGVNVRMADYVYAFLEREIEFLWNQYRLQHKVSLSKKRSFQVGLLRGFDEKLAEQKGAHPCGDGTVSSSNGEENPSQMALQLLPDPGLQKYLRSQFPHCRRTGGSAVGLDSHHFGAGHAEGKRLTLRRGVEQGGSEYQGPSAQVSGPRLGLGEGRG